LSSTRDKELTFTEHLKDLRKALKYSALALFVGFLISWSWAEDIFNILRKPIDAHYPQLKSQSLSNTDLSALLQKMSPHLSAEDITNIANTIQLYFGSMVEKSPLYYSGPFEPFLIYLKVALLTGLFVSFPFIFYFIWKFFSPAVEKKEARIIIPIVMFASALFIGGALSGYFLVFPFIIDFALSFAKTGLTPILTMDAYFKIFSKMLIGFGIIFELPLILVMLAFMRIVSARGLMKFFKFALILIFLTAALLTPPDLMSQVLMAAPLIILYLFSIFLVLILEKFRKNKGDFEEELED